MPRFRFRDSRGMRASINRRQRTTMATIEDRAGKIIAEHLDIPPEKVTETSTFADLGADSLDSVEIVMAVEEEFDIEVPDEEADGLDTFGKLVGYITKALAPT